MSDNENNWGNKKQQYYSMNKRDADDSDYIEEEKEAIRLQKKKLDKLKALNLLEGSEEVEEEMEQVQEKKPQSSGKPVNEDIKAEEIIEDLQTAREMIEESEEDLKDTIDILLDEELALPLTIEYLKWRKDLNLLYALLLTFTSYLKVNGKMTNHHPSIKKIETIKHILASTTPLNDTVNKHVDELLELINTKKAKEKEHQGQDEDKEEEEEAEKMLKRKRPRLGKEVDDDDEFIKENWANLERLKEEQMEKKAKEKERVKKEVEEKNRFGIRKANKEVLKARGIYRKRKQYLGNAKLVNREKYYKKEKQRKSLVKVYEGKPDVYGGEATRIRTDLIRSTKIKS